MACARVYVGSRDVGENQLWFAAAKRLRYVPGVLDVVAHGDAHAIAVLDPDPLTADRFAVILRENFTLSDFDEVRLLACWTGREDDGFAARLCEAIRMPVLAPRMPIMECNGRIAFPTLNAPQDFGLPVGYDHVTPAPFRRFQPR